LYPASLFLGGNQAKWVSANVYRLNSTVLNSPKQPIQTKSQLLYQLSYRGNQRRNGVAGLAGFAKAGMAEISLGRAAAAERVLGRRRAT
jgi:hypothetical protein